MLNAYETSGSSPGRKIETSLEHLVRLVLESESAHLIQITNDSPLRAYFLGNGVVASLPVVELTRNNIRRGLHLHSGGE